MRTLLRFRLNIKTKHRQIIYHLLCFPDSCLLPSHRKNETSYFLCCAEERRVQMRATMTTTTTVMAPTETTMMTRRLLFFWGVALPWGGRIWPMGDSEIHTKENWGLENINKKHGTNKQSVPISVNLKVCLGFLTWIRETTFCKLRVHLESDFQIKIEMNSQFQIHFHSLYGSVMLSSTLKKQVILILNFN